MFLRLTLLSQSTARHGRLTKVIPDVHLSAQRSHFDDLLTEEIVRFSRELGAKPRFEIVVFVPETSRQFWHRLTTGTTVHCLTFVSDKDLLRTVVRAVLVFLPPTKKLSDHVCCVCQKISWFYWNLVLWLSLPMGQIDCVLVVIRLRMRILDYFSTSLRGGAVA